MHGGWVGAFDSNPTTMQGESSGSMLSHISTTPTFACRDGFICLKTAPATKQNMLPKICANIT